ncbi:MAG: SpoIID/LytB domain-containing protein [Cyanobacteria bacterium]|nr:SpoIID/LytB domain-containing protein [Cyanobacteriota bacterium]
MVSALRLARTWTRRIRPQRLSPGRNPGLSLLLWLLICLPASALELRVAVQEGARQITVGTSNDGSLKDLNGQSLGTTPAGRSLVVEAQGNRIKAGDRSSSAFWVEPSSGGYVFIGDRWYRGRVLVIPGGNGLTAINYVDLEQYLYSVVGGEMPTSWPLEALKAQSVSARSYVLYHRQRNRNPNYDVGSTTAWQVYGGLEEEAASTQTAVEATRGQVLTYNGQIIEAVFHSASGGHTENVEDVWSQPVPYLRAVQDFDAGSPVYQWTVSFSLREFGQRVPGVGNLIAAAPVRTTPRGRIVDMRLEGDSGSRVVSGNDLRRALNLRSTLFSIAVTGTQVQISGRGFGHGVGLSQWGAHNLAQQGYTYQQILAHYYQGVQLSQIQAQ